MDRGPPDLRALEQAHYLFTVSHADGSLRERALDRLTAVRGGTCLPDGRVDALCAASEALARRAHAAGYVHATEAVAAEDPAALEAP